MLRFTRSTLALLGAALAVLIGLHLLPPVAAQVSAEELRAPTCPPATNILGFPVAPTLFVKPPIAPARLDVRIDGTLPLGLSIAADPTRPMVAGIPQGAETTTFTVNLTLVGSDGSSQVSKATCTMKVKPATIRPRAGTDRYDQSVMVSKLAFPAGSSLAYLASGEKFADALSASSVAALHDAPLLLVTAGSAPGGIVDELNRLDPSAVVIVGGPASVSDAVLRQVEALPMQPRVTRVGGADRFAVSRNLIAHPDFGVSKSPAIFLATGSTFPDALSASPAAARRGAPVLLIDGTERELSPEESALVARLGVEHVSIVGGPASVSGEVESSLRRSFETVRFGGDDRFAVSAAVNDASFPSATHVYLASGAVFPDALSGGAAAGMEEAPLLVTPRDCIDSDVAAVIGRLAPDYIVVLGGSASLCAGIGDLVICPRG